MTTSRAISTWGALLPLFMFRNASPKGDLWRRLVPALRSAPAQLLRLDLAPTVGQATELPEIIEQFDLERHLGPKRVADAAEQLSR